MGTQPFCWFCHVTAKMCLYSDKTEAEGRRLSMVDALEKEVDSCLKKEQLILPVQ